MAVASDLKWQVKARQAEHFADFSPFYFFFFSFFFPLFSFSPLAIPLCISYFVPSFFALSFLFLSFLLFLSLFFFSCI